MRRVRNRKSKVLIRSIVLVLATLISPYSLNKAAAAPPVLSEDANTVLSRVPSDAAIFGHLRIAHLWDSPLAKEFREKLDKELGEGLKGLKSEFGLAPDDLDSVTFYAPKFPDLPLFGEPRVMGSPLALQKLSVERQRPKRKSNSSSLW